MTLGALLRSPRDRGRHRSTASPTSPRRTVELRIKRGGPLLWQSDHGPELADQAVEAARLAGANDTVAGLIELTRTHAVPAATVPQDNGLDLRAAGALPLDEPLADGGPRRRGLKTGLTPFERGGGREPGVRVS